ncbi:3-isopropylmalate dehydrogenase [Rhodococcus rhodochrous J3]|uniref:Isocitrate/isopropylmalate dehydrogenase family protein n=2 Tax=Rhodococcus rhodochrous TaxID=1829 RepID=A0AA46WT95_RHORH|nr:isocitrate/isopropylmalate family dehydrogenase [Rhodococcus rhodochrous]AYA26702.1 isocitrate/isopropylmalate dehydrogenase family protein [Rhodococcus rhodochrous]MBF4476909.1 isocitrate/isopropylmalate dehydrogenase family protein [Rhodococcus rhodochrous]MCB8908759.1 isocitrate/isopropylmalate dehydrogenase family protein [Rhodococcus rhodochrous]MCD2095961.1 isocitrate/isopropylmalate dehydrogenase family protein [Rhodococcus rhodochrous]MCD2120719.1 isocitrate/isopropylmalate dehydrog
MTDDTATLQTHRIGLLEGDGIGPEIVPATRRIVDTAVAAAGVAVDWVPLPVGASAIETHGNPLPQVTLDTLTELDAWILGPHDSASYPPEFRGQLTPGGRIRKHFDLYANIRPACALPGAASVSPKMDLVVVRENTEGFYADRNMAVGSGEFMPTPDIALAVGVITRAACERIAHTAFDLASRRRKRVTIVHKANVLARTTGLFRDVCQEVGRLYPSVTVDDQHVDAMAALLVRRGADFDVIVTENMFGDILSDLAAELSGSLGTAASINASRTKAMAQAAHGAAPDIAGQGRANPIALILSAAMLLDRVGARADIEFSAAARAIEDAVRATVAAGVATADLGGTASTDEFTAAVIARLEA